jgi:hypothetical protein
MYKQIATIAAKKATDKRNQNRIVTGRTKSDMDLAVYQAEQRRKTRNNILKGVVGLVVVAGAYKIGKNIIKNQTDKNQSPEVQYAKRLRTAMSPSGIWWIPDGTYEKGVYQVAYEIADNPEVSYKQVQKSYKKLYGKNLSEHLEGELSTDEYTKFLNIVDKTYNPETDKDNPQYFSPGKMVVMTEKTSMFKEQGDYFSTQTFPENSFLINAMTTGREKTFVDLVTGGSIFKQKRIEIKKVKDSKTRWLDAEGIITKAFTKENLLDYKNKGYRAYKLS